MTGALALAPARADRVASPEETRALRAKLAASPPGAADIAAQPYPGAVFDADCSANHTAPRLPDSAAYCFYTRDPIDKVREYVAAEGKPRNGVRATVGEQPVAVDGIVKIDKVTMVTYWTHRPTMAFYESFPAEPPPAAELIAPMYPGATYDRDCSAARSLEAKGKPKWRQVWCYVANEPAPAVRKAFDSELTSTSRRGVQVDLTEVSRNPPVTRIEYWLTAAPPQVPASASPPQAPSAVSQPTPSASAQEAPAASSQPPAAAPQATTQPAPGPAAATPPAPAPNPAGQALDAVNKLRGLFGR